MKWWLFVPVIILVLVQTTIINFNFLLLFILFLVLIGAVGEALTLAFISGLLLDLSGGGRLGLSSLGYLIPIGIVIIYSRRFQVQNLLFWLLLFPVSAIIFDLITSQVINYKNGLIFLGIGLVFYLIVDRWELLGEKEEGIKLRI